MLPVAAGSRQSYDFKRSSVSLRLWRARKAERSNGQALRDDVPLTESALDVSSGLGNAFGGPDRWGGRQGGSFHISDSLQGRVKNRWETARLSRTLRCCCRNQGSPTQSCRGHDPAGFSSPPGRLWLSPGIQRCSLPGRTENPDWIAAPAGLGRRPLRKTQVKV